jgi:hypothetical protein
MRIAVPVTLAKVSVYTHTLGAQEDIVGMPLTQDKVIKDRDSAKDKGRTNPGDINDKARVVGNMVHKFRGTFVSSRGGELWGIEGGLRQTILEGNVNDRQGNREPSSYAIQGRHGAGTCDSNSW